MDGFQSGVAVLELLRICWSVGKFLKRIKDADRVAEEVHARVERLAGVLHSILAVLKRRVAVGLPSDTDEVASIERRIVESTEACVAFFDKLEKKVEGGFDFAQPKEALLTRFRIACRNTSIVNRQVDLDARISILQTDLVVLQLFDHAHTHHAIGSNHADLVRSLHALSTNVSQGHKLLRLMREEQHRKFSVGTSSATYAVEDAGDGPKPDRDEAHDNALAALDACLDAAESVHERYTSEYDPDLLSDLGRRPNDALGTRAPSPEPASGPPTRQVSVLIHEPSSVDPEESPDEHDILESELLDDYIVGYKNNYVKERDAEHYHQAEINLNEAIRYSEMRARQHGLPFTDKLELHEEIAVLYQRQGKRAEAVKKVSQLLNESSTFSQANVELIKARQHQLLSSIYLDRHTKSDGNASLSLATLDIQTAEKHAMRAYNKRQEYLKKEMQHAEDEKVRQVDCMDLLVKILLAQHKSVEANAFQKRLAAMDGSSSGGDSIRRISTAVSSRASVPGFEVVEAREDVVLGSLVDAIKQQQHDQIDAFLAEKDLDLERLYPPGRYGKTALMYAVEASDERTVLRLLDPNIGGVDVNTATSRGLTALHMAAEAGLDGMIRSLVDHDADLDPKDRRGETALVKAVRGGRTRSVQLLFELKADVATKNVDEYSLLHHAVRQKEVAVTRLLLDIRPDLRDRLNSSDQTPLLYCAEQCSPSALAHARALLEHDPKADVNYADSGSRTALWHAASKPRTRDRNFFVELLMQHGAEFDPRRPPLKGLDYPALQRIMGTTRGNTRARTNSTSTAGTGSTSFSRISRLFGRSGS